MKYADILGLYDYFQPVYDITNEVEGIWKRFSPNDCFQHVLQTVLSSLESGPPKERKPLWMQGTYGTGKSHAMAVIKHLLWDEWGAVEDFAEHLGAQHRERLKHFRQTPHNVFPVILKGATGISDNRTFGLVIERAVNAALHAQQIQIATKSDFEKIVAQIETNPMRIDWDEQIQNDPELSSYVSDKHHLLSLLRGERPDIDVFRLLEGLLSQAGWHLSSSNISRWLCDVADELRKQGRASSLMLFWDEFTTVMELPQVNALLTELQHIAELSVHHHVSLFVISHRDLQQTRLTQDDLNKILGRFHSCKYHMESVTTYHIVSNAIRKTDQPAWEALKKQHLDDHRTFDALIQRLLKENEGKSANHAIRSLFPIHPYTAYLATFIAREIGSTERSIFTFLYETNKGFSKFIADYPQNGNDFFLTSDWLWDFFLQDFENTEKFKFGTVIEKYRLHGAEIGKQSAAALAVFKGALLLNILQQTMKITDSGQELVTPSVDNINAMFAGTHIEASVADALTLIDKSGYISQTPDHLFLVSSAPLPQREIEQRKQEIGKGHEDVTQVFWPEHKTELDEALPDSRLLREKEICFLWAGMKEYALRSRLMNAFEKPHTLHIALIFMKSETERPAILENMAKLSAEPELRDVIFALAEDALREESFDRFLEYRARAYVAEKHNYADEKASSEEYSKKVIDQWVTRLKGSQLTWQFRDRRRATLFSLFAETAYKELSPAIFPCGLELLRELKNHNVWKPQNSVKAIEVFLYPDTRTALEGMTEKYPIKDLRWILKDHRSHEYIVTEQLALKPENVSHPLARMKQAVDDAIEKAKQDGAFHLGNALDFLKKPPYGLYANYIYFASMGFIMGRYIGKLFESGTGRAISKEMMREKILSLFKYWQDGKKDEEKLYVRYGTLEEKYLNDLLKELFGFTEVDGLTNVRWAIRNTIKKMGQPLWVFSNPRVKNAIDEIVWLTISVDRSITQDDVKRILEILKESQTDIRTALQADPREKFVNWLRNIDAAEFADVTEEKMSELAAFLQHHLQEEIPSWDEDKVREKVKDWKLEKIRLQEEREREQEETLVKKLCGIFNLHEAKNIRDARYGIRAWIAQTGYPLWVFKPSLDETAQKTLDEISELAASLGRELSPKDMERVVNAIQRDYAPLKATLNPQRARDGFLEWLRREDALFERTDANDVFAYIQANVPQELAEWDEGEIRAKAKGWLFRHIQQKQEERRQLERALRMIISDVFGLPSTESLQEMRVQLRTWVNAPLWVYKTMVNSDGQAALDELVRFTLSETIPNMVSELHRLLSIVQAGEAELRANVKKEKASDGFRRWLRQIPNVDISSEQELLEHLAQKMPKEVVCWEEHRVRECIIEYQLKKAQNELAQIKKREEDRKKAEPVYPADLPPTPVIKEQDASERIAVIKRRIQAYQGDVKALLLDMIDQRPEICDLLEKYLA